MHPTAAARIFPCHKGHLVVTTRFIGKDKKRLYRFAYDLGNKMYAAYVHALFGSSFIMDVFSTPDPNEEKLGDAIDLVLGMFDTWDSVPQCAPSNLQGQGQAHINGMRRGLEQARKPISKSAPWAARKLEHPI